MADSKRGKVERAADLLADVRDGDSGELAEGREADYRAAAAVVAGIREGERHVDARLDAYNKALEAAAERLRADQVEARARYETAVNAASVAYNEAQNEAP